MALETKVDWNGAEISKDMDIAIFKALTRSVNIMQAEAKLLVRKDTHNLEGSIVKAVNGDTGIVSTNSVYAKWNEFGTGRYAEKGGRSTPWFYEDAKGIGHWTYGMKPQPFMRPALNNNKKTIISVFEDEIEKVYK